MLWRRKKITEQDLKSAHAEAQRTWEERYPANDSVGSRLGLPTTYGSIAEAEEKAFPWLKRRRAARRG